MSDDDPIRRVDAHAIRQAAKVLLDAMTARPAKCDPFDPCDQEVERLAIQYSGQGGDAVAVLETAEKFMLAGLRALIGTTPQPAPDAQAIRDAALREAAAAAWNLEDGDRWTRASVQAAILALIGTTSEGGLE